MASITISLFGLSNCTSRCSFAGSIDPLGLIASSPRVRNFKKSFSFCKLSSPRNSLEADARQFFLESAGPNAVENGCTMVKCEMACLNSRMSCNDAVSCNRSGMLATMNSRRQQNVLCRTYAFPFLHIRRLILFVQIGKHI